MHTCPECGMQCDCDGEDHDQPAPRDCSHECPFDEEDEEDGGWAINEDHSDSLWDSDPTQGESNG